MRRSSILGALRGPDGRALGVPLAILFLLSVVASGLYSGALAAGEGPFVICGTASSADLADLPGSTGTDHLNCCVGGCCPAIVGLAALATILLLTRSGGERRNPALQPERAGTWRYLPQARGPPLVS